MRGCTSSDRCWSGVVGCRDGGSRISAGICYETSRAYWNNWHDVSREEIMVFVGLILMMGILRDITLLITCMYHI